MNGPTLKELTYPSLKEMRKHLNNRPQHDRHFTSPMDVVVYKESDNELHVIRGTLQDIIPVAEDFGLELVGIL